MPDSSRPPDPSKGGRARASVLTPEERSEIARRAVRARWAKAGKPNPPEPDAPPEPASDDPAEAKPEIPYSAYQGTLTLGNVAIECHVLNDGRRVLAQREIVRLLSGGRDSGTLSRYLTRNPSFRPEMTEGKTFKFRVGPNLLATGHECTLLIELCESYLDARAQGLLHRSQLKLAMAAEIIVRATAKVGIIALVDEATGYEKVRKQRALQAKLQAFIADDLQEWARMFPDDFWLELARLEGIRYSPRHRPLRWGRYVMMFVYDTIDSDIGRELRKKNPNPRFLRNHHQWLRKFGRDKVQAQIAATVAIMKLCKNMEDFRHKFARVFAKQRQLEFDDLDWFDAEGSF